MEHEYLIIKEQDEDLVVTGLKDNAPSDIVMQDGVAKIGDYAFYVKSSKSRSIPL